MLWKYIIFLITISCSVLSRRIGTTFKENQRKLFISQRVITESREFEGGILVDRNGVIEGVLSKEYIGAILSDKNNDIEIIDGGSLALMAGIVDSHVHVNEPGRTSWEGYVTATQAAAAGGVTTIIDMPLNSIPPTTTLNNLKIKAAIAREEVYVDVGFWGGVVPGNEIELRDMIRAGVVGFKCFLSDSGVSEFPHVTPNDLHEVFAVLNGTGTVLAFHAEVKIDNNTSTQCEGFSCPDPDLYTTYLATHPPQMELEAASLVTSFLNNTEYVTHQWPQCGVDEYLTTISVPRFQNKTHSVRVHIVHVSAAGVVPILEKAREERIHNGYKGWRGGVTAETCNHYLTLSSEQIPPGRSEYKCSPPIRDNKNKAQLWNYIREKRLDLVTSDHSPSVASLKGSNFLKAWGGISSMQFDLPLFWTEAKARGFSLSTVSHYLSAGPARLVGLQDRKGALRPGLDADLIFVDPNASFLVTPENIRYKNKISPYMNRVLTGKVIQTYIRGNLVYADGVLIGGPKGKLLLNDDYTNM